MKHKFTTILVLIFLMPISLLSANKDIVTLVAIGSAQNRGDAINNALRSAIEQTYGAFISSQTRILNDKLISDEIVAVSSGNINKYKILSESQSDGKYVVSINAEVSVSKLASFAESHGQSCSYDGDLLSNNIRLMKLRAENTTKCINNLERQLSSLYKTAFDFKIDKIEDPIYSSEPKYNSYNRERYRQDESGCYYFPIYISCMSNKESYAICELVRNTFLSLAVSSEEYSDIKNFVGVTYVPVIQTTLAGKQDYFSISNLLDKCLYDITVNVDGIIGTKISLVSLLKRKSYLVKYSHGYSNGRTTTSEYIEPSPFGDRAIWSTINDGLKEGILYDNYVYVYEPRYQWYHEGFGHNDYTTFGEKFLTNPRMGEINKFELWELNKKKSRTVYRIKVYVQIPENQLSNFKGFSVSR